ncbi:MAG: hypothetical protein C5B53_05930 [Candidatus Melainabacteria bacterium]|nr:MAG: hypothetical protein C5B53_05930 [Candidatus Melainabacteria bacterium]
MQVKTKIDLNAHSGPCLHSPVAPAQVLGESPQQAKHAQIHARAVAIGSFDNLGMAASTLCLIHCLLMPFVITMLPIVGWQCLESKHAHHILAAFVFAFAIFAIVPGYLKHRRTSILISTIVGLSLVLIATFLANGVLPESLELPLITVGNLILVATHWQNRKLTACDHSH